MAGQTLSTPGTSGPLESTTSTPPADADVITIDSDDDDNDLFEALDRVRKARTNLIGGNAVSSSSSGGGSTMPNLFTRDACEVLKLRPKKESPPPEQSSAGLSKTGRPQDDTITQSEPNKAPKSTPSIFEALHANQRMLQRSKIQAGLGRTSSKHSYFSENSSSDEGLEVTSTTSALDSASHLRVDQGRESLNRKRPHRSPRPHHDKPQIPSNARKKVRISNPAGDDVLHGTQKNSTQRQTTSSRTKPQTKYTAHDSPPPPPLSKIQAPIPRISQADRDLFRELQQQHEIPRKIQFANSISDNIGPDLERLRKSTAYAPSRQEHRKEGYRVRARAKRAGEIHDNIAQRARNEFPNKSEDAIQQDASARVGAWQRERAAEDKAERQFRLDGLKVQERRAVTNLSSATPASFLGKNQVVAVFTVFQSEPFDEDGRQGDGAHPDLKVVRLDSFTDMKKANDLAIRQLYGGLRVNREHRKEVSLQFDEERHGVVYGSARLPNGKKFICFVKKEKKQVGQLDPRIFEGKKMRDGALKLYQKRFDVLSVCVRARELEEEEDTEAGSEPQVQEEARESSVDSEKSTATIAAATFPEQSANPVGHRVYDPEIHGSYVDRESANQKAFEVMRRLWYPRKPRLDAHIRYRDEIRPWIEEAEKQGSWDIHNLRLTFNPELHDSPYEFLSSTV